MDIKAVVIKKNNKDTAKVAVGICEITDKKVTVTGFYIASIVSDSMAYANKRKAQLTYLPFSEIGGLVQTQVFPISTYEGETVLPPSIMFHIEQAIAAEKSNLARKNKLKNMPIPGRNGLSPEEQLAQVHQYIKANGVLPKGKGEALIDQLGVQAGVTKVVKSSPYRQEFEKEES